MTGELVEFKHADVGMRTGQRRLSVDPEYQGRWKDAFLFSDVFI